MDKESKSFKIDCRLFVLSAFLLLGILYFYNITCFASPMYNDTVSVNASIKSLKQYADNKVAQKGARDNVFIDLGESVTSGILEELLPSSLQPDGIASYVDTSEFIDAYENNDMSYFEATFGIYYESDYDKLLPYLDSISDSIINSIESDILIYQCPNISHVGDFVNLELNATSVRDEIFHQYVNDSGNITPIFYYRWRGSWGTTSFVNTSNNNEICVDGLVLDSGNWSDLVNNIDSYRINGYLPPECSIVCLNYYYKGVKVNAPFYHNISHIAAFPSFLEIYPYDTISGEGTRCQSGLFSSNHDVFLFFRSQSAYLKFNNSLNKSILPYDFSLNFPNTDFSDLDFSQILKVIRDNGVLQTQNIQELYKRLDESFSQGIQDIVDAQKSTNELLLALLRYYDKNIVKDNKNITDILVSISDTVGVIRDNILFTDDDYTNLSDEVNEAINNSQIKHKLENTFPFSVKRDFEHVLDYFDEDIIETNPRFVFNFDLFHDEVHDYVEFDVDLTQLPGINIFRSFFHAFIVILFNFACFKLYDKFLTWYLS